MNKNKGFSLVELIVVVAIMAVLVGILAPAYLSYVEKTRRGTDENMAEEVRHTVEVATAELEVYEEVNGNATYKWNKGATIKSGISGGQLGTKMSAAVEDVYGNKTFDIKSKKYNGKTYTVTISGTANGTALNVNGAWN